MITGSEIIKQVFCGKIRIEPFSINNVGPNSVDLTLANKLRVYTTSILDPKNINETDEIIIPEDGYVLEPGRFYLGSTNESVGSSEYIPMLHGRSSTARLGLCAHVSAGLGDLGWFGQWTLEMFSPVFVRIYPNLRVCQTTFEKSVGAFTCYDGKYQNQTGATVSKMWMDKLGVNSVSFPMFVENILVGKNLDSLSVDMYYKCLNKKFAYLPWDKNYCVCENGEVFNIEHKDDIKHLPKCLNSYKYGCLIDNEYANVDFLVASAFIGCPIKNGKLLDIIHINGKVADDNLSNLIINN